VILLVKHYFVEKGFKYSMVKDQLFHELRSAGLSRVEIAQAPLGTRIILYAQRPGMVIGQRGGNIQALTSELEKKYNIDNPHVLYMVWTSRIWNRKPSPSTWRSSWRGECTTGR